MKKIFLLVVLAAAMSSCGNSNPEAVETSTDSSVVVQTAYDSTACDSIPAVVDSLHK